jgi:hypothetical protein
VRGGTERLRPRRLWRATRCVAPEPAKDSPHYFPTDSAGVSGLRSMIYRIPLRPASLSVPRRRSQVVRQRSAKPPPPVRIWAAPLWDGKTYEPPRNTPSPRRHTRRKRPVRCSPNRMHVRRAAPKAGSSKPMIATLSPRALTKPGNHRFYTLQGYSPRFQM